VKAWIALGIGVLSITFMGCSTGSYKMLGGAEEQNVVYKVSDQNYSEEESFEWKIAKGDRIQIMVANQSGGEGSSEMNMLLNTAGQMNYQTKDGSEGFLIPKDGTVRLPLIGSQLITGLTEDQAAAKLIEEYKKYLKNPFVSVKILNQKLFVVGEVRKPGVVQVTNGTMSLFEALAYSGDLTEDAERTNLKIIRGGLRHPIIREVNLADMSQMKLSSLILQPNDIVYIQPRSMKAYNVAFKEQMPFFQMLSTMLTPFVNYNSIKNGAAINVFPFQ
jgi:polysaccharide export outer membrane protein